MIVANRIIHEWLKDHSWYYDYFKYLLDPSKSPSAQRIARLSKKFLKQRALYYILGGACRHTLTRAFIWESTSESSEFWLHQNKELVSYLNANTWLEYSKTKSYKGEFVPWII